MKRVFILLLFCLLPLFAEGSKVSLGIDVFFSHPIQKRLNQKKIGLLSNAASLNGSLEPSYEAVKRGEGAHGYTLTVLFTPEHGLKAAIPAEHENKTVDSYQGIPVYSLHRFEKKTIKPIIESLDFIVCDLQDIGSRSYTYATTLFHLMEIAAECQKPIIVLDRPNPINGLVVDGPLLQHRWRSMVGYVNVPYCHGMTLGELALFFNEEYHVGASLTIIPMEGWKRSMTFHETGLPWIPSSPNIPESTTPLYYPMTGILGELHCVNIGVGQPLPFRIVTAPWIDAKRFSTHLNAQKFPGVRFIPYHTEPKTGTFAGKECAGVLIVVTDHKKYKPVSTQYLIIGILKSLYPKEFQQAVNASLHRKEMFCKVNGTDEVYTIMTENKYIVWKLKGLHEKERQKFSALRKKYLLPSYPTR